MCGTLLLTISSPRCTEDHNEVWGGVRCHLESIFKSGRLTPPPLPLP